MPEGVIAALFAIAFLHVFPQCSVGIELGRERRWSGNGQEVSAELLYRTIDRMPDADHWTDRDERFARDEDLERRVLSFRSRRYPQVRIFFAQCVKTRGARP